MKLSHLSLAIFAAISLAACGGSDSNNNQVTPNKPEQPKPEQPKPEQPATEDKIIDPTQTGVVGDINLATEASVGTTQYIRGSKSKFDRDYNPNEATSATAILGVTLNKQNPWLSNIALAQLKTADGKAELVQYLGNEGSNVADLSDSASLQKQNEQNVVLDANLLTAIGNAPNNAVDAASIQSQLDAIANIIAAYQDPANATLSNAQEEKVANLLQLQEMLSNLKDKITDDNFGRGQIALDQNDSNIAWGDNDATDAAHLADGNNGNGPKAIGLVGVNYTEQGTANKLVSVQGEEAKSKSSTRIFGRNFNSNGGNVAYNSYLRATPILLTDNNTDYSNAAANTSAEADIAVNNAQKKNPSFTLAAVPNKLNNVQYGRVTGNLNPAQLTKKQLKDGGRFYKQMNYLTKGNKAAVDTYFFRGTNATTIEQMAALPKGKELTYAGHALMYGLDNSFHGDAGDAVPNAFGENNAHALGNFVIAKVDLDKAYMKGSVYNEWQEKGKANSYADVLVSFDGNIFGNTVLGEAQRTYDKSDKADFRASFFGKTGDELGGSINSTTWQERYGAQGDVWGGVFGAKRIEQVNQLTNQWLGDIPEITGK